MRRGGRWTANECGEEQRRLAVTTVYTMRRGCRNRVLIEGKGTFEDMRRWGSESVCRTEKGGCQHGTITLIEIEIAAYGRRAPGGRRGAKGRGLAGRAEGGTRDGGRCWAGADGEAGEGAAECRIGRDGGLMRAYGRELVRDMSETREKRELNGQHARKQMDSVQNQGGGFSHSPAPETLFTPPFANSPRGYSCCLWRESVDCCPASASASAPRKAVTPRAINSASAPPFPSPALTPTPSPHPRPSLPPPPFPRPCPLLVQKKNQTRPHPLLTTSLPRTRPKTARSRESQ